MRVGDLEAARAIWSTVQRRLKASTTIWHEFWLSRRLELRTLFPPRDNAFVGLDPSEIPVYVINLKRRPDRLEAVLANLKAAGFKDVHVLEAIDGVEKYPNLARGFAANLGCTLSHEAAILQNLGSELPVAICEDDNEFLVDSTTVGTVVGAFLESSEFDVLGLSVRVRGRTVVAEPMLSVVSWALAPAFYIAKPRAKKALLRAYRTSAHRLERQRRRGPFDQVWRHAQRRSIIFAVARQKLARQRESFSDIQGKYFQGT